ncbi:MAG: hypothetical protein DRI30_03490 [Chloroflexi bacterium]|nr:MAG: hypothetical protein DRI30_03490 [Chloroflexota bacterium]
MSTLPVILALIPELITSVRVESGVQRLGGQLRVVETEEAFREQLALIPSLAVIDLGEQSFDVMGLVESCREARVPVLAFGPHADLGRQRDALRAGVDFVYPRSKFMADPMTCMRAAIAGSRA